MDERKIDPGVLAAEHYIAEEGFRKRSYTIWIGAFASALVGAAIVLAVVLGAPQLFFKAPATPPAQVVLPSKTVVQAPVGETKPATVATPPVPASQPSKDAPKGPIAQRMPPNPFIGTNLSTVPEGEEPSPAPLSGSLGNYAPVQPPQPPKGSVPQDEGSASLLIARSSGGDPEAEGNQIAQALRAAGASVRVAPHYSLAGNISGMQVVATIPSNSLDRAVAGLSGAGAHTSDRWKGSAGQREGRVASMIASRMSELKRSESELREKYEDDAAEVAAVREEIQKLNQCLAAARGAGKSPAIAIILVSVGSL